MSTILCIDDEEYLLDDIAELMTSCGYKTLKATDGTKGLQMILHLKPDLVISDVSMPGMNGMELVKEIRHNHSEFAEMPFIFLSALTDRKQVLSGYDHGADDYLTKPVDFELLTRKVRSALRQVERLKQKNELELIKLVESLSTGNSSPPSPTSAVTSKIQNSTTKPPAKNPRDMSGEEIGWREKDKVYGATVNIKNAKTNQNHKNKNIIQWVADTTSELVKQLFPGKSAVTVNKNGGIFVCYSDADDVTAAQRTKKVTSNVESKLRDKSVPKPFSDDEVLELTLAAEAPYQTTIDPKIVENSDNFSNAINQQIEASVPEIESASDLIELMESAHADIVLLKMIDKKGRVLPIKFFNFDKIARDYISTGFSCLGERAVGEAGYKIDCMFLRLLLNKISTLNTTDIVMVDVHYPTLVAPEFRNLYIPKLKEFSKSVKHKVILNVRGVTKAAKNVEFKEVLKPLGAAAKGCTIQITPEDFLDFVKSPLPVSGIVCSFMQTDWDTFSADHVQRARASLTNSRIPMIVRGVPSEEYAQRLHKFGFDGYGISDS